MAIIELGESKFDAKQMLFEIERANAEDSLSEFIKQAWHIVEPGQPYIHNWHVDLICEHLEAITEGEILPDGTPYNRLLINVPPGMMKSLILNVFWPAWEWGPRNMPHLRYICAAHQQNLAVRDSTKMRRLVISDWYQKRWGDRVQLTKDQNMKTKFENTSTGFREAVAAGSITGARGDRVLCFPYGEIVHTEHGPRPIGDLVLQKVKTRVWSSDPGSGRLELKPITAWKHNPESPIIEVGLSDGTTFKCTPDHKIWTSRGWVPAGLLSPSDVIPRSSVSDCPNSSRADAILGGKLSLRQSGAADRDHIFFGQFRPAGGFSSPVVILFHNWLDKLFPCFSASYLFNRTGSYAKAFCKSFRRIFTNGNSDGLFAGQNCSGPIFVMRKGSVPFSISNVFGTSSVFEITKPSVGSNSVFVPNFLSRSRMSDKCEHHSLMHKNLFWNSVSIGVESWISLGFRKLQNFFWDAKRAASRPLDNSSLAPDATQIAYAVETLETDERFPIFVRDVGHANETFCLSVEDNHSFYVGNGKGVLVSNCDDPHSVEGANSEAMRRSTIEWFLEAVPTRLNNPRESAIVVIMQRLHEEDVSGIILNKNLGYDHIMLPMMYDPARAAPTKLGIEDPREEEGELLFPARFPQEVVERDSKVMGPYAFAGQMQQSPEPRGGGIIKRDWWQVWEESAYPPMDYVVASLDTAYTTKQENDFSAMTVWGVFTGSTTATIKKQKTFDGDWPTINSVIEREYEQRNPSVMLMSAWQEKLPLHELVEKVASTCRRMGVDKLLIEDKAAGHSVAQEIQRLYGHEDWMVQLINPGAIDKMARLYSIQHLFAEGMIHAPDRQWADAVINQCATFPRAKHDDLVDTVSMGLRHMREIGLLARAPEIRADIQDEMRHTGGPPPPLYPV